jgi:hypothetical protein
VKSDKILTELANFSDPRSYVRRDGSEVLYEADWKARVKELSGRAEERCEHIFLVDGCEYRCSGEAAHPHHRVKRSRFRDDRISNLIALCVPCHRREHPEKQPQWTHRGVAR